MANENYLNGDSKLVAYESGSFNCQPGSNASSVYNRPAGAWRRFFARTFDFFCIYVPLSLILFISIISSDFKDIVTGNFFIALVLICVPLWLLLEAGLYALIKTTPGKFMLGIQIQDSSAKRISAIDYAFRNAEVYTSGLFLGIPLLQIVPMANQFINIKKKGKSSYDEKADFNVVFQTSLTKTLIFSALYAGMFFITAIVNQTLPSVMPHATPATSEAHYADSVWTNRVTGTTSKIDGDWSIEESSREGVTATTFSSKTHDVSVVLLHEYSDTALESYAQTFQTETEEYRPLGQGEYFHPKTGSPYWIGFGYPKKNTTLNYATTIIKSGNSFWRIITIYPDNDKKYEKAFILEDNLEKTFPN